MPNTIGLKNYVENVVTKYSLSDFKSHFRLTKLQVEDFCKELELKRKHSTNVGRPAFKPLNCLLLTLWALANQESYRTIADRFGVSPGNSHTIFINTCKSICFMQAKYIRWPTGAELEKTIEDFNTIRGRKSFPNVIGCVDGTHIAIRRVNDNSYYNRKGYYSMLLQVISNSKKEFLDVFCGWPGSCHDSRMWQNSPIYNQIENGLIPDNYHLLGDSAYPLRTFLMVPFKDNGHLNNNQKVFNKFLSSTRVIVENSIGLLKGVFRRLKYIDLTNIENFKYIVVAACVLHNFKIKNQDGEFDDFEDDRMDENYNEEMFQGQSNALGKLKRDSIMLQLIQCNK